MPDFQEPSGEGLRQQQELLRDYEGMMLHGMQAFRGIDPARQSTQASIPFLLIEDEPGQDELRADVIRAPQEFRQRGSVETSIPFSAQRNTRSLQHWEVRAGVSGYCQIDGCSALTFPLIEFRERHGRVLIKFTVPLHRMREAAGRSHLSLWDGEIFGEVMDWQRRLDEDSINFTLCLQLEAIESRSQPGEAVRYTFDVDTTRYRRGDGDAFRLRLERAGLLPDRVEALRELMEERAVPDAHERRALAEDWHYRRMERAGIFDGIMLKRSQARQSQPPIKQPTLCNGCRYLHGHTYGGTKLICGVHPYGNGENCSDFEAK